MFEAKFRVKHRGCWTNHLKKFKSIFITHNTVSHEKNLAQDILEVVLRGKDEAIKIKKFFRSNKLITKESILYEDKNRLLFQVFTDTSDIISIVQTVLQNKCFVSSTVPLVDGYEIWTIAAPKKTALKNAIEAIRKLGSLKLLYIKKSSFDGYNLSKAQDRIIRLAVDQGYYSWPKKTTLGNLSKIIGVSKPTAAEHLRKAEIKVIKKHFSF
jgi:predicted DNA binding protein